MSSLKRVFLILSWRDSAKFFICLHRSSTIVIVFVNNKYYQIKSEKK